MPADMRTWIKQLEEAGELERVRKPVDPHTQLSALLWQSPDKALFFEQLAGFPGWRSLAQAPAGQRHIALALSTTLADLVPTYADRMQRRIPPELVATGPVKEVISGPEQLDLRALPANISGHLDGGPYITAGLCITRDPDTGARNLSYHRLQIKARDRSGILMVPRHTLRNYKKYEAKGEAMPIAVTIGHHPALYLAGAANLPYGEDELELAGALLGDPVRLVRCESIPLEAPADAEIVLEGEVLPDLREPEGPFAEFQGYYLAGAGENPIVQWRCVTRRRDAIYKHLQNELEGNACCEVNYAAIILRRIRGIGGGALIKNIAILPGLFGVVVQMTPQYFGEAKTVLMGALATELTTMKTAIAVDDDVDIFNSNDILWSLNTRVNPETDITVIPRTRVHAMDPTGVEMSPAGSLTWQRLGSRVLIDATKPPVSHPTERSMFERIKPPNWGEVFLKDFL